MKIVIVGLGGVGGVVGGRLAAGLSGSSEHEVVFWCRGKTLSAISTEGLRLLSGDGKADGKITVRPALATCNAEDVGRADLLIFATKNYHLDAAARELAPLADGTTTVIPLLNGVSAVSVLERRLPESDVLGGCIYVSAHVDIPGTVRQVGTVQRVFFGKRNISEADNRIRYGALEQALKKSGIGVTLTERIDVEIWSKFIFLSPFAGATTLFERSIGDVLTGEESAETVKRMIQEVNALAAAKNIDLPENIAHLTLEKARAFPPSTKTSMQLDREKDRKTELESLIGWVCGAGRTLGVPTPAYDAVYDSLKAVCKV
ncbi:MAG: 2-dehydropantoate 2-reductase [Synergistaceae bacterium]|jgi:2-dehydropantoate 2-reductase|nr:2-dehydropantoate 2-reductase [Synergistaceae bacterium]